MNLKRIFWSAVTLIIGCSTFAACSSDDDSIDPDKVYRPGKDFIFSVNLDNYSQLRATYEESQKEEYKEESAIKSLYLFILDGKNDNSQIVFKSKADNIKPNQYMAKVSNNEEPRLAGGKYVVLVANHEFTQEKWGLLHTLNDIKSTVDKNINLNLAGTKQSDGTCGFDDNRLSQGILMLAEEEITLDLSTNKDLGTIDLVRRISKISVIEPFVSIKGHDGPFRKEVALLNYTTQGKVAGDVVDAGAKTVLPSSYIAYNKTIDEHIFRGADFQTASIKYPLSFYTYYTEWEDKAEQLAVEIKLTDTKTKESYYYLVRIDPKKLDAKGKVIGTTKHTEPNVSYDVMAKITRLGSKDPYKPTILDGNSVIVNEINWSNGETQIKEGNYIYFDAAEVAMATELFPVSLHSSSPVVDVKVVKSEYLVPSTNAQLVENVPVVEQDFIPTIDNLQSVKGQLESSVKIKSKTPDNYCIKYFIIEATNEHGGKATLLVKHYPPKAVTMVSYKERINITKRGYRDATLHAFKIRTYYNENDGTKTAYPTMMRTLFYDDWYYATENTDTSDGVPHGNYVYHGNPQALDDVEPDETEQVGEAKLSYYYIPNPQKAYSQTISPDFIVSAPHNNGESYLSLDKVHRQSGDWRTWIDFKSYTDPENAQYFAKYQMPYEIGTTVNGGNKYWRQECLCFPLNRQEQEDFVDINGKPIVLNENWFAFAYPRSRWYDYPTGVIFRKYDNQNRGTAANRGDYSFVYCLRLYNEDGKKSANKKWRVPTSAEMNLIVKIRENQKWQAMFGSDKQNTKNILLSDGAYWSSDGTRYVYGDIKRNQKRMNEKHLPDDLYDESYHPAGERDYKYDTFPKPLGYVRCVKDIKDDQAW